MCTLQLLLVCVGPHHTTCSQPGLLYPSPPPSLRMDFFDHCPSITELTLDMYSLGWDNQQLATAVCDAKAGNRNNGRSVIFSHGSAGLVVAHALREGLCTFGDDARWYAIGVRGHNGWAPTMYQHACVCVCESAYPTPAALTHQTPWGGMEAADATSVCSYAYGTYSSMFNEIGFCSAGAQSTAVSTLVWGHHHTRTWGILLAALCAKPHDALLLIDYACGRGLLIPPTGMTCARLQPPT